MNQRISLYKIRIGGLDVLRMRSMFCFIWIFRSGCMIRKIVLFVNIAMRDQSKFALCPLKEMLLNERKKT